MARASEQGGGGAGNGIEGGGVVGNGIEGGFGGNGITAEAGGAEVGNGRAMTEDEALVEARRRWGTRAEIAHEMTCVELCMVGEQVPGAEMPEWHGIGRTWELAFAEADARAGTQG